MRKKRKPYKTGRPRIATWAEIKANPRYRHLVRVLSKEFGKEEPIRILK